MGLKLIGEVSLDGSGFLSGLDKLESQGAKAFGNLKSYIAGAFTAGAGYALEDSLRKSMEAADKIQRIAETFGLSPELVQQWAYAAEMADTSLDSLTKAYKKFAAAKLDAQREPEGGMASNLKLVGIELNRLNKEKPEALMLEIAAGMASASEDSDKFAAALKILGKSADDVLPALKALSNGVGKQAPILSDSEISALAEESDAWKRGAEQAKGLMGHVGAFLANGERVARGIGLNVWGMGRAIAVGATDKNTNIREQWQEFEMDRRGRALQEQWRNHPGERGLQIPWQQPSGVPEPEKGIRATLSNDEMRETAEYLRRANELQERTRVQGLTKEERITELLKKQISLKEDIAKLSYGAEYGEKSLELAKGQAELAELQRRKDPRKPVAQHQMQGDSLIRVGNFLGSSRGAMESIAQRQVELLQQLVNLAKAGQPRPAYPGISDGDYPD